MTWHLAGAGDISQKYSLQRDQRSKNAAATKIQALYRGHAVRQGLSWKLPGYKSVAPVESSKLSENYKLAEDLTDDLLTNSSDESSVGPVHVSRISPYLDVVLLCLFHYP